LAIHLVHGLTNFAAYQGPQQCANAHGQRTIVTSLGSGEAADDGAKQGANGFILARFWTAGRQGKNDRGHRSKFQ
jgi:hypothetical protein